MKTWTPAATQRLEEHLKQMRMTAAACGSDPDEIAHEIRQHIEERLEARQASIVTDAELETVMSEIAQETSSKEGRSTAARIIGNRASTPAPKPRFYPFTAFFAVILPIITTVVELVTRMSAALYLDPMPDIWHMLMILALPAINAGCLWSLYRGKVHRGRWLLILNGFALGIATYYTILYSVILPFALIGILIYGLGFLPLSTLFALLSTWRLNHALRRRSSGRDLQLASLGIGFGSAGVVILLAALPIVFTRQWEQDYVSGSPEGRRAAVSRLRTFGRETVLLTDCYGSGRPGAGPFDLRLQGRPIAPEAARTLYYAVTGKRFNATPPPQQGIGSSRWNLLDELIWDGDAGGTVVGGHLKDLSLFQSRMDGLLSGDAAWSYVEWTLEFQNNAQIAREARAQIQLPPGGVVSRLTLWVDGSEREAAFAACDEVRGAYRQVVQVERRDPVLVTSSGPDRVMLQCFPVPVGGGTIKVRVGITAPLTLESGDKAVLSWPHFIERNFGIPEHLEHSLWIESKQPLQADNPAFKAEESKPGIHGLRGLIRDAALAAPTSLVRIRRDPHVNIAWVTDPHGTGDEFIQQRIEARNGIAPKRVVFLVDGSKGMKPFQSQISEALKHLPTGIEASLMIASDEPHAVTALKQSDRSFLNETTRRLGQVEWKGGQDNLVALLEAWDLAGKGTESVVVWIHEPQPVLFDHTERIEQRMLWSHRKNAPLIYDLQTSAGPDLIVEKLYRQIPLTKVPRLGTVQNDLVRLFAQWNPETQHLVSVRERLSGTAIPLAERGKESSTHLARLWANDEVHRKINANKRKAAITLASQHQLVTPVSGAVVLETKQQFDQAGLQPVSSDTVPVIPEPGTIALLVLGVGWFLMQRSERLRAFAKRRGVEVR